MAKDSQTTTMDLNARLLAAVLPFRGDLSYEQIAQQSGCNRATVSLWMRGKRSAPIHTIEKIAAVLGCELVVRGIVAQTPGAKPSVTPKAEPKPAPAKRAPASKATPKPAGKAARPAASTDSYAPLRFRPAPKPTGKPKPARHGA